ncbi:nicotinate-nucleotide--dimethylbenzimidazole phosphoribosyltransferase [Deltaproteobacteria bacterium]|nr:nicotinate-nucleotide--dimethylbenzimidazole phosphoribosyltransferase [Deltaproteobacteria bacterium]
MERILSSLHIKPLQERHLAQAQTRLDSLTKPRGSLGRLEELAKRLFAMREGQMPLIVNPAIMLTVAADHGVAAQNVSPVPQAVTRQMTHNFLNGGAAVNALCHAVGMDLRVIDAGCAGGPFEPHPMLLDKRLGNGTTDISLGPAMPREICLKGLASGVNTAADCVRQGYACLGVGEMGIANSTAAAALYCALLTLDPDAAVGPGAGADAAMVRHKVGVVRQALSANAGILRSGDPVNALAALGGFEIVLLCGLILGAAAQRLPVLVDGFICGAAYAAALKICPEAASCAVLAHTSAEPGHAKALAKLTGDAKPLLDLGMRLGEGTGAAAAYPLLRCAAAAFNDMATFNAAGVTVD